MLGSGDPSIAIPQAVNMALNALKSSSAAGLKRFVYTSSSFAVTQPKPGVKFTVTETTFNEEAVEKVKQLGEKAGGATVYSASKVEVERAMQKWQSENPSSEIVVNCGRFESPVLFSHHAVYTLISDNHKSKPQCKPWARSLPHPPGLPYNRLLGQKYLVPELLGAEKSVRALHQRAR
jgi:nucleoside-diphosphate-sugar epimerase